MSEYRRVMAAAADFAAGDRQAMRLDLQEKMKSTAAALQFERAAGLKDRLQRLAELVGRFRNLAIAAQAEKTERVPGQIEGVELGGDLGRMLAQSWLCCTIPSCGATCTVAWPSAR